MGQDGEYDDRRQKIIQLMMVMMNEKTQPTVPPNFARCNKILAYLLRFKTARNVGQSIAANLQVYPAYKGPCENF